eukprot:747210-Prorocentrum_minimum.AAC.1
MLKGFGAWFGDRDKYEASTDKYLALENPALLGAAFWALPGQRPPALPEALEPGELARALGVAIALGRTLLLPFMRCRGDIAEGAPDLQRSAPYAAARVWRPKPARVWRPMPLRFCTLRALNRLDSAP